MKAYTPRPPVIQAMPYDSRTPYEGPGAVLRDEKGNAYLDDGLRAKQGPMADGDYVAVIGTRIVLFPKKEFERKYQRAPELDEDMARKVG